MSDLGEKLIAAGIDYQWGHDTREVDRYVRWDTAERIADDHFAPLVAAALKAIEIGQDQRLRSNYIGEPVSSLEDFAKDIAALRSVLTEMGLTT